MKAGKRKNIKELFFIGLAFITLFASIYYNFIAYNYHLDKGYDFAIYMSATGDALRNKSIYTTLYASTPFTYPPSVFIITLPFFFLPFKLASLLWNIISLLCFSLSFLIFSKLVWKKATISHLIIILSFFFFTFPLKETISYGQINAIVLLFVVLSIFFLFQKNKWNEYISGICLGIASCLKVVPVFLILFFLIQKKWKAAITTAIVCLILNLIPIVFHIPFHYVIDYLFLLPSLASPHHNSWAHITMLKEYDQSLTSFLFRYFSLGGILRTVIIGTIFIVSLILSILRWRKEKSKENSIELFCIFFSLVTLIPATLAWEHHLLFLYPLLWLYLFRAIQYETTKNVLLFVTLFTFITLETKAMYNILHSLHVNQDIVFISYHSLFALLVLLGVYYGDIKRKNYTVT